MHMDDLRQTAIRWIDAHGSSKAWLARQLGCHRTHLHCYLLGERIMSRAKLDKLREIVTR